MLTSCSGAHASHPLENACGCAATKILYLYLKGPSVCKPITSFGHFHSRSGAGAYRRARSLGRKRGALFPHGLHEALKKTEASDGDARICG